MIRCVDLVKEFPVHGGRRRVLDRVNFTVAPGQKLGILGRNGAGKSTLMKIIGGVDLPTSGHVQRSMSVSWPLAFGGAFQGSLTGLDNLRFMCRIYQLDYLRTRHFVDDFAELGRQIHIPVKNYSSGMRMRLAFALTLAVEFECLLIDEILSVEKGDIQAAPDVCSSETQQFVRGVLPIEGRMVTLLSLARIVPDAPLKAA